MGAMSDLSGNAGEDGRVQLGGVRLQRHGAWGNPADNLPCLLPPEWMKRGLCTRPNYANIDFDESNAAAKAVCASCEVQAECLEFALINRIDYCVYGGKSPKQRELILRARRKPRKSYSSLHKEKV